MKNFNFKNYLIHPSLREKKQNIVGTINPIQWDEKGKIKKFSIYTDLDEDILIENYPKKRKLKSLLGKRVEAIGVIKFNENGDKLIILKKIRELPDPGTSELKLIKPELYDYYQECPLAIPKAKELSLGFI
jgi:hypothetical protein